MRCELVIVLERCFVRLHETHVAGGRSFSSPRQSALFLLERVTSPPPTHSISVDTSSCVCVCTAAPLPRCQICVDVLPVWSPRMERS